MGVLIEKTVENVFEKTYTPVDKFWDNLEKMTEVSLPEELTQLDKVAAFWDDLVTDNINDVNESTRSMNEEEKAYYKGQLGCSDHLLDCAKIDDKWKMSIQTINEWKGGQEGENGVKYERKTIFINGFAIEAVFPAFNSAFDIQLPEEIIKSTDAKQLLCCNVELKEAIEDDQKLTKLFTPAQLEQIKNGDTPDGYTWHHYEEKGKMQLVKTEDHQANRHTGGKAIWGGGKENR